MQGVGNVRVDTLLLRCACQQTLGVEQGRVPEETRSLSLRQIAGRRLAHSPSSWAWIAGEAFAALLDADLLVFQFDDQARLHYLVIWCDLGDGGAKGKKRDDIVCHGLALIAGGPVAVGGHLVYLQMDSRANHPSGVVAPCIIAAPRNARWRA